MKSYVLQAFVENPWAMLPQKLAMLEEIVARHVNGEKLSSEEIEVRLHGAKRPVERYAASPNPAQPSGIAILPLFGSIFPKANLMTEMSGATSADMFGARFDQLVNDPQISSIKLSSDKCTGMVLDATSSAATRTARCTVTGTGDMKLTVTNTSGGTTFYTQTCLIVKIITFLDC